MDVTQPSFLPPVKVVKSNSTDLAVWPRALWVGVAGTANLVYADGSVALNFPLFQGLNPVGNMVRINTGGTSDDIWLLL